MAEEFIHSIYACCLHLFSLQHFSGNQKRSWDMIVDTASILNKESRKALQLLQGLKGTRLIIPRLGKMSFYMIIYFV